MIEFRWLRFHCNDNDGTHPTAINDAPLGYVRVLQYREEEGPRGKRWWGDWKDIPMIDA